MREQKKHLILLLLLPLLIGSLSLKAQTYTLYGNTFEERCESLINSMVNDIEPYTGNVTVKFTAPFYWARIYKNVDVERAHDSLENLYKELAKNPAVVTDSDIDFFAHHSMHGYLLCKDKISGNLVRDIKQFLQGIDFNKGGAVNTLNLDMMRYTAGYLAAQEWPDFKDLNNKNASQIMAYNRPRILNTLDNIFHNNCKEMDATVYLPTNTMHIRMLAEFAIDAEIKQKAYVVYQQIIAAMVGAWNNGLYVASPSRAKGWNHLTTGKYGTNSRTTALAWLFFGNPSNEMILANQFLSDTNNYAIFCFWSAYKGKIKPMQEILDVEKTKTFPYEYHSYIDDKLINSNDNTIRKNWHYYKYTYQSDNFGLSTQTEIPYDLSRALSLYTYKETKRTYLAWHNDIETSQCYFSVCQDNPERPTDVVNANAVGYGENPYHRVLQHKGTAIGITNVPTTYLNGNRYQLYVPFTRLGIKHRIIADNWVLCHTGNMMFAFKTIEPFTVLTGRMPYNVPNCDLLMFTDQTTRKGSWILETTEITNDLRANSMEEELDNFRQKLISNSSIKLVDYESNTPRVIYTSMDGNILDLTFFPPNVAYNGQYKINNYTIDKLDDRYLFNSQYTRQAHGSDDVYIYNKSENPTILNWKDEIPTDSTSGLQSQLSRQNINCFSNGKRLFINNIPNHGKADCTLFSSEGQIVKHQKIEIAENKTSIEIGALPNAVYIIRIKDSDNNNWTTKWIKST